MSWICIVVRIVSATDDPDPEDGAPVDAYPGAERELEGAAVEHSVAGRDQRLADEVLIHAAQVVV